MHIKLAETVFHMFKAKDKQVIFWPDVYQSLKDSNMGSQFVEQKEYTMQLSKLSMICPEWISLVSIPKGLFIKQMKKTVQLYEI